MAKVEPVSQLALSLVSDNWNQLRCMKNYEEATGKLMFQHLFQRYPRSKLFFGFPINAEPSSQAIAESKRFVMHASYFIQMLETALNMLGTDDADLMIDIMLELGKKHESYGVTHDVFPILGDCLCDALEELLNRDGNIVMTDAHKKAWIETYKVISHGMIHGQCGQQQAAGLCKEHYDPCFAGTATICLYTNVSRNEMISLNCLYTDIFHEINTRTSELDFE